MLTVPQGSDKIVIAELLLHCWKGEGAFNFRQGEGMLEGCPIGPAGVSLPGEVDF